ncbi:uncharacterized protein LOC135226635 [Macrobrachium nipponense]|uniref:uncharacterized protein LOC135226635 n=1 Tax=Macrobrachium nipponense TaxID=159736 RepID=UPI0030C8BC85
MFSLLVVLALVASAHALPTPADGHQPSKVAAVEKIFNDRPAIEAIISCFMGKTECRPLQQSVKVRAIATMLNFGTCPKDLCSPEESQEMERSMELLQSKHPDLWARLIFSILGVDIKDLGKKR